MKNFIYSIMTDKKSGGIYEPLKALLYLASLAYGAALWVRKLLYSFGIFKTNKVPVKVISVGNLTLGGTGKTPFTVTLARMMADELRKNACVLIRGYGWDEQAMLKNNLGDIPVLVGEDRVKSAHRAIKLYGCDAAVLDDGFQHWELRRDLDIVLIDAGNPLLAGHLFPRGILREPREELGRADIAVFTKINKAATGVGAMKEELRKLNKEMIFLEAVHKPSRLYEVKTKKDLGLEYLGGKRVILFSSIGDPEYFEDTVKRLGAIVLEHIVFGDHHDYKQKDADRIGRRCDERKFDLLVTTEKDAVKLQRLALSVAGYPVAVLAVELDIVSGKENLRARLHSLYTRKMF